MRVNWLKNAMTILLVALWPLVTGHCKLESIPCFQFLSCGPLNEDVPHQDNDCDADSCAQVESGLYKTEDSPVALIAAALLPAVGLDAAMAAPPSPTFGLLRCAAITPPELAVTWQFVFRAASPPRAPSFAS